MDYSILYFLTTEEGIKYSRFIDLENFTDPYDRLILDLLKQYYENYRQAPSKDNLVKYLHRVNKQSIKINTDLEKKIATIYRAAVNDTAILEEATIEGIQQSMTLKLFRDYAAKVKTADRDLLKEIQLQLNKIVSMSNYRDDNEAGMFLLNSDYTPNNSKGYPSPWKALNNMTSAKGFLSPELIIFAGGPKTSKTLVLITTAIHYATIGLDVCYFDYENGLHQIQARFIQSMLNITFEEAAKYTVAEAWEHMKKKYKMIGAGQIYLHEFKARVDTTRAAKDVLSNLKVNNNFVPDVIMWDYIDLIASTDPKKDRRLTIQESYHNVISINKEYKCFSFSVSKVTAEAFLTDFIEIKDLGEDKEKAYNCHAMFALNRNKQDMQDGTIRLCSMVQRRGSTDANEICLLVLDNTRQQIDELNVDELLGYEQ